MSKPRWKVLAEIALGILVFLAGSVAFEIHVSDPVPWNVAWVIAAVANWVYGIRLVQSNWRIL